MIHILFKAILAQKEEKKNSTKFNEKIDDVIGKRTWTPNLGMNFFDGEAQRKESTTPFISSREENPRQKSESIMKN